MLVWCGCLRPPSGHLRGLQHVSDDMPCPASRPSSRPTGTARWGPEPPPAGQRRHAGRQAPLPPPAPLGRGAVLLHHLEHGDRPTDRSPAGLDGRGAEAWSNSVSFHPPLPGFRCINNDRVIRLSARGVVVPTFVSPVVWREGGATPAPSATTRTTTDTPGSTGETFIDMPRRGAPRSRASRSSARSRSILCLLRTTIGIVGPVALAETGVPRGPRRSRPACRRWHSPQTDEADPHHQRSAPGLEQPTVAARRAQPRAIPLERPIFA